MTTAEFPSTDAICSQVRNVLVNGPKTVLDEVLFDFLRGYMKHSRRQGGDFTGSPAAKQITAKLTYCRHGRALAVLESQPFNGMEARPAELLALAQTLIRIAHAAVEHNNAPRRTGDARITLEVENV